MYVIFNKNRIKVHIYHYFILCYTFTMTVFLPLPLSATAVTRTERGHYFHHPCKEMETQMVEAWSMITHGKRSGSLLVIPEWLTTLQGPHVCEEANPGVQLVWEIFVFSAALTWKLVTWNLSDFRGILTWVEVTHMPSPNRVLLTGFSWTVILGDRNLAHPGFLSLFPFWILWEANGNNSSH